MFVDDKHFLNFIKEIIHKIVKNKFTIKNLTFWSYETSKCPNVSSKINDIF